MTTVANRREAGDDTDGDALQGPTTREVRALSERMVVLPPRLSPAPEAGADTDRGGDSHRDLISAVAHLRMFSMVIMRRHLVWLCATARSFRSRRC